MHRILSLLAYATPRQVCFDADANRLH